MTAFEWDDLRCVLAVARGGSLSAAARTLGVNHSTVYRRLGRLEEKLATRLFDRDAGRLAPTAAGEDLLGTAGRVEAEMQALDRRLTGRDTRLTGRIRLTAPDDIAFLLLPETLSRFRESYPGITLDLAIDNRMLSLTRREADVAVRPTLEPPETLVGRKVVGLPSAAYRRRGGGEPSHWIGWDEGEGPAAIRRWIAEHVPADAVVLRTNSMLQQRAACEAGLGAAILPCFLGDRSDRLERIGPPEPALGTDLWLLTHADLRRTARVRALMDLLFEDLRAALAEPA